MYSVSLMEYNTTPTATIPTPATDELYIYDPLTTDEGLMLTEPILSLEASCAGTFSCTLPETNYGYGKIIKHRTRLIVRQDDEIIFMGRISTEDRDLYLNQKIEAEGALAYLNDSLTEKKVFTKVSLEYLLNYIFTNHNTKFPNEPWKHFNFPYDSTTDTSTNCNAKFTGRDNEDVNSNKISYYSVNFYTSMETVSELLDLANAVLKLKYNDITGEWDVYIYDKYNLPKASQPIEFGVNLIDLIQSYDTTDICSAVAPFGGDLQYVRSKEIGEMIAGKDKNTVTISDHTQVATIWENQKGDESHWYPGLIYVRDKDNASAPYNPYLATTAGYWIFRLNIETYNNNHPNNKLTGLYVSWRGYKFDTTSGEYAPENRTEDCAWRVYDSSGDSIGYRKFNTPGFDSDIDEFIDLTTPQYYGAKWVVVSGWGEAIFPQIRRNAITVEENDKLSIHDCDVMGTEESEDLVHEANSYYLYSKSLRNSYGLIEKKLEYDIEDTAPKVSDWVITTDPTTTDLGTIQKFNDTVLGYIVPDGDENVNRGHYEILSGWSGGYATVQYELPSLGDPKRPRGVYISARMHSYGLWEQPGTGIIFKINGLYALFDESWQVLAYKEADVEMFTSAKDEYIDLSDAKYYGAKYIRVGAWGGVLPPSATPSDDAYSRDRLLAQAELYLTKQQWEKIVIEATAVDLNMTSSDWERFDICTDVTCYSDFHGIEGTSHPLTRLDIQLDNFENNVIKLGYDSDEYLSYQLSENLRLQSVAQTIEERRKEET